jgi:hypothetical protein
MQPRIAKHVLADLIRRGWTEGRVVQPSGPEDPQLILWRQAEQWAMVEMQRDGPQDESMLWNDAVRQRITLTQHQAGELVSQWTTNDLHRPQSRDR